MRDSRRNVAGSESPGSESPGSDLPDPESPDPESPGSESPGSESPGSDLPDPESPDPESPEPKGAATRTEASSDKADAPAPDHPDKVASPSGMTRASWRYAARRTVREFIDDQAIDMAAALTYWSVLAVAPAALALVSMLGVFGDGESIVARVMDRADDVMPAEVGDTVEGVLTSLTSDGAGIGLATGLLVALWSASAYVNAFARAMNRIYEVDEGRPFWKLRPIMLLVTLVVLVLVASICVAMALSGPVAETIGAAVGLSGVTLNVWNVAKWPVILALVVVIVAILYYATPNVQQPKFRWISIGAFVAILVWALATVGFGFYVSNFGNYDATYGALAGFVLFLLWLWITNNALLLGAEIDAEVERARQLQSGIEAERSIQLPPRDTTASDKRQKKAFEDLEQGKALRANRGRLRPDE